jgi:SAM-dependent methyltransferase
VWYHRVWQYLRLLRLITSIRVNTDFLIETFRDLASDGRHGAVLISGTADYGMLAHLRHAYGDRPLDVTVLDLCDTPLLLNTWYGDRYGLAVTVARGDALEHSADRPFDVICTHNLLGRFDRDSRRTLVARWHSLLRPGGVVVTTQRVEPRLAPESPQAAADRARLLRERVVAAALDACWSEPDAGALADAAYEGWRRRADGHRIRSTRELTDVLEAEGFDVLRIDRGGGNAERSRDRGTPAYSSESYRMRLVARRR